MKAYKLEVLVLDFDNLGGEEIISVLEDTRYPNRCINPDVKSIVEKDVGDFDDDHPLNNKETSEKAYHELFDETQSDEMELGKAIGITKGKQEAADAACAWLDTIEIPDDLPVWHDLRKRQKAALRKAILGATSKELPKDIEMEKMVKQLREYANESRYHGFVGQGLGLDMIADSIFNLSFSKVKP